MESFELEGTCKDLLDQLLFSDRGHLQLDQVPQSPVQSDLMSLGAPTMPLGNLLQCPMQQGVSPPITLEKKGGNSNHWYCLSNSWLRHHRPKYLRIHLFYPPRTTTVLFCLEFHHVLCKDLQPSPWMRNHK